MKISNGVKRIFLIIFISFFLIFLSGIFFWHKIYLPRSDLALLRGLSRNSNLIENKIFLVKKGQTVFQIAENLENQGLIKNRNFFTLYVSLKGENRNLKAGQYSFSSEMPISEIAKKIIAGETIKEKITIIEGWNLRDIAWYFEGRGISRPEEFFELVNKKDFSEEFDFLGEGGKPKNSGLEGYLFPDTYQINRGEGSEEIIKIFLENFDKKLTLGLREEIEKQGKTIFEIITMASLIEKEVRTIEDKKLVSGILWKRLKNKMPLQVDATISYITGRKTTKIYIKELQIDSPYNTYKYLGLPRGPISNPGFDSILAAVYPESSEYWYYLSTPEGETIFSKNLSEHNIAREKYLR